MRAAQANRKREEDGDPPSRRLLRPPPRWREPASPQYPAGGVADPPGVRLSRGPGPERPGLPPRLASTRHRRLASTRARPRLLRLVICIAVARTRPSLEGGAARRHVSSTQPTLRRAGRPLTCLVQRGRVITLIDRRHPHDAVLKALAYQVCIGGR